MRRAVQRVEENGYLINKELEYLKLSHELDQWEENFKDRVDRSVVSEVLQYKQAYRIKSRVVALLRRHEPKSPSPRGA